MNALLFGYVADNSLGFCFLLSICTLLLFLPISTSLTLFSFAYTICLFIIVFLLTLAINLSNTRLSKIFELCVLILLRPLLLILLILVQEFLETLLGFLIHLVVLIDRGKVELAFARLGIILP